MKNIFFGLFFVCVSAAGQSVISPLPMAKNKFIVIAHRGNHVSVPENTVAAVWEAIKSGADYVEIDLRTTKDGFLVLSHDATVDRMTDGKGNVRDLTLEEIKKLKVKAGGLGGSEARGGSGGAVAGGGDVYRMPEFKEVLEACKGRINIYLDFKDADVAESYRQIKAAGMEKSVVVYLNKVPQYKDWRTVAPQMPLMSSLPAQVKTPAQLEAFLGQARIEAFDNVYDTALQTVTRAKGIAVWLDVEGRDENETIWRQAMGHGVQGVQTDHPEALIGFLNQNKLRDGLGASASSGAGSSGSASSGAAAAPAQPTYRHLPDIAYGMNGDNTLDAYVPYGKENARVIVYLHGGGWTGGDKGEFPAAMIEELVGKRKYIFVTMNYRLVKDGKNHFPAQIEDISQVLSFLSSYADRYHYNGKEFALMGGSAGAYLAMLYAYGYDSAHQIKTVVDFWGPTDLADKDDRAASKDGDAKIANLLGVSNPQAPECMAASPYYRLTKVTGVPTILFHGGEDPLVHYTQAEKLYKKLLSLNIPAQYEFYPHEKHGVGPAAAMEVFQKTLVWLDKYYPSH